MKNGNPHQQHNVKDGRADEERPKPPLAIDDRDRGDERVRGQVAPWAVVEFCDQRESMGGFSRAAEAEMRRSVGLIEES